MADIDKAATGVCIQLGTELPVPPPGGRASERSAVSAWAAGVLATGLVLMSTVGLFWPKSMVPMFLVAAAGLVAVSGWHFRRLPRPDLRLVLLLGALILVGAVSSLWAVDEQRALERAIKCLYTFGFLVLVWSRDVAALFGRREAGLFWLLIGGMLVGGVLLTIERQLDFPLFQLSRGLSPAEWAAIGWEKASVQNRGVTFLSAMVWPAAAFIWHRGRPWLAVLIVVAEYLQTLDSGSSTAMVAGGAAVLVFGLASWNPRPARWLIGIAFTAATLATPLLLPSMLSTITPELTWLPHSAHHRIEIYDFVARRIIERPWLGWGLDSTGILPYSPEELKRYLIFVHPESHAHNSFLQIWVELGLPGLVIGLALLWLVLIKTAALPEWLQPFALACTIACLIIASLSYSLWSSSWLVTMASAALVLQILAQVTGPPQSGA